MRHSMYNPFLSNYKTYVENALLVIFIALVCIYSLHIFIKLKLEVLDV